jgi:hypothetical protein
VLRSVLFDERVEALIVEQVCCGRCAATIRRRSGVDAALGVAGWERLALLLLSLLFRLITWMATIPQSAFGDRASRWCISSLVVLKFNNHLQLAEIISQNKTFKENVQRKQTNKQSRHTSNVIVTHSTSIIFQ